jgi:BASS family bile acid:Na+ symporter
VLVLVPAAIFVLLLIFDLPPAVTAGLILLAAAPGAPLTTKRSKMVGADETYVSSLQLILAISAVLITPLILGAFYAVLATSGDTASPLSVARQIAQVTLLPVIIGLALQRFAPQFAARITRPLGMAADGLFLLMILGSVAALIFVPDLRAQLLLGWQAVAAILITAIAAVLIGHSIGGPSQPQRAGLVVACLARNIGLAMFIGELNGTGGRVFPTLLAYMILGMLVQVSYTVWAKGRAT